MSLISMLVCYGFLFVVVVGLVVYFTGRAVEEDLKDMIERMEDYERER